MVGYHLLHIGLQASKGLFCCLQPLLCSLCMSSRLSQHPLNIQCLVLGPGCTLPEGYR